MRRKPQRTEAMAIPVAARLQPLSAKCPATGAAQAPATPGKSKQRNAALREVEGRSG